MPIEGVQGAVVVVKVQLRHVARYLDGRSGGEGIVKHRSRRVAEGCGLQMVAERCDP